MKYLTVVIKSLYIAISVAGSVGISPVLIVGLILVGVSIEEHRVYIKISFY